MNNKKNHPFGSLVGRRSSELAAEVEVGWAQGTTRVWGDVHLGFLGCGNILISGPGLTIKNWIGAYFSEHSCPQRCVAWGRRRGGGMKMRRRSKEKQSVSSRGEMWVPSWVRTRLNAPIFATAFHCPLVSCVSRTYWVFPLLIGLDWFERNKGGLQLIWRTIS